MSSPGSAPAPGMTVWLTPQCWKSRLDRAYSTSRSSAAQYRDTVSITTGAPSIDGVGFGAADYDRDGKPDFYVVERKENTRVRVYSGASGFTTQLLNTDTQLGATASEGRWHYSLADMDVDGVPDLVAIRVEDDVLLRVMYGDDA